MTRGLTDAAKKAISRYKEQQQQEPPAPFPVPVGMRHIKYIVIHTTATPQTATVASILKYWKETLGWRMPGYHYLIEADGTVHELLPISSVSNGVHGHNSYSIHISYIGGIDAQGNALDNRTPAQQGAMELLTRRLKGVFPDAKVQGHRDFLTPGKPGWKDCPSFDAIAWAEGLGL